MKQRVLKDDARIVRHQDVCGKHHLIHIRLTRCIHNEAFRLIRDAHCRLYERVESQDQAIVVTQRVVEHGNVEQLGGGGPL
jgi:hypothetical protein